MATKNKYAKLPTNQQPCLICSGPDNEEMVQCDKCDRWYHYNCVNVTSDIVNKDFICVKCTDTIQSEHPALSPNVTVREQKQTNGTTIASSKHKSKSSRYSKRQYELEITQLEEELKMKTEFLSRKYAILTKQQEEDDNQSSADELIPPIDTEERTKQWVNDIPVPIETEQPVNTVKNRNRPQNRLEGNQSLHQSLNQPRPNVTQQINNHQPVPTCEKMITGKHLSARQVMPKDLPYFSGKPEEWPVFISNFENTTKACGFTDKENLVRLQRCLKGKALEAVRSMLLIASTVPQVIETLRMLFGRPELIIHTLLIKIRSEPAPKLDKLDTVINFALSVQNLCATIEASGLLDHLCNPTLMQELTDKLPPQIKINWAMYKQTVKNPINLSTLGNWLFELAKATSDVTIPNNLHLPEKQEYKFSKEKKFVNVHAEKLTKENSPKK